MPEIIAWNSSSRNELGFEWTLVRKWMALYLVKYGETLPEIKKITFTEKLAALIAQLQIQTFPAIGSLYIQKDDSFVLRSPNQESGLYVNQPDVEYPSWVKGNGKTMAESQPAARGSLIWRSQQLQ